MRGPAVVDASALAALLFGEPSGPEVAERLRDRPLYAPSLLPYEVASVCARKEERLRAQAAALLDRESPKKKHRKKARKRERRADALASALSMLPQLGIREVQVPADEIVRIVREAQVTAGDAAYLWLARELDAELVRLDDGR